MNLPESVSSLAVSSLAVAERRLRTARVRPTPARIQLLALALDRDDLFSAYDLRESVRAEATHLNLSTIYRTLDAFEALGLLERTGLAKERRLYRVPHQEAGAVATALVQCRDCGRIETINLSEGHLAAERAHLASLGYSNILTRVEFSVTCAHDCSGS